jgi:phospholipase C
MTQQSRRNFLKTTAIGSATVALGASGCSASELTSKNAMDHVVVVLFENRSFDNILGYLYKAGEVPQFEGVIGKNLSNPVPSWAKHQAPGGRVYYGVSTSMNSPGSDPGEEYPHTNTQMFNTMDDRNKYKMGKDIVAPWNAPKSADAVPNMQGFVTDYISNFTADHLRQPTFKEYSEIMSGFTPEQIPVITGLAKGFSCFDHWYSEVPSQTFPNRSFWVAGTSSGFAVNAPADNFLMNNKAETIFNRLSEKGKTWKIYVGQPDPLSFTALVSMPVLKKYFATHIVPFSEYEKDCANGTLPNFAFIEPPLVNGHADYHPSAGMAMIAGKDLPLDPPSSTLSGEAYLSRIYNAYKGMGAKQKGSNVLNTTLLVGWDEPGGTYDHVPPPRVPAPQAGAPKGQCDFDFTLSGYRTPAVLVSPWIPEKTVFTEEFRHTSLIATLRKVWDLGKPFTQRDASARTLEACFTLKAPRDPSTWPNIVARPAPAYVPPDPNNLDTSYSELALAMVPAIVKFAKKEGFAAPSMPKDPNTKITGAQALNIAREFANEMFPLLAAKV